MKKIKFPTYKCIKNNLLFETREDLISYEQSLQLEENIKENIQNEEKKKEILQIIYKIISWLLNICESSRDPLENFGIYKKKIYINFYYLIRKFKAL